MSNQTYHFKGEITTLEPLTVSIAKQAGRQAMPRNGEVPYFPSTSINGAFRHSLVNYVLSLTDKPTMSLETFYSLSQGYIVDNDVSDQVVKSKTSTPTDKDVDLRVENPILSIFGRWSLAGKFGVGSALALKKDDAQEISGGYRCNPVERDGELEAMLPESEVARHYNIIASQSETAVDVSSIKKEKTALTRKLKSASDSEKTLIRAQISELDEAIKSSKNESGEARETIRRPIDSFEAIIANTNLQHRMTLKRGSLVELGAALYSIAQFSKNPKLGGKQRHNCGAVEAHWTVRVPAEDFTNKEVGKVGFNDEGFYVEGEVLESAMVAFKAGLKEGEFNFNRIV
ncbi:hypothetical protein AB4254_12100 [Vibrio breoganii]